MHKHDFQILIFITETRLSNIYISNKKHDFQIFTFLTKTRLQILFNMNNIFQENLILKIFNYIQLKIIINSSYLLNLYLVYYI